MKTILLASQKGGSGKSTLAAHFAVLADASAAPALLIDADPQGSLAYWHALRPEGTPLLARASAANLSGILEDARASGIRLCVMDAPPHNAALMAALMRAATITVVPVRPGVFDLAAAEPIVEMARSLRVRACALVNAAPPPTRFGEASASIQARAVLGRLGLRVLPGQVSQRAALAHALVEGRSVIEFEPDGQAAREVSMAWAHILEEIGGVD